MHQQIRTGLGKASSTKGGPGAMELVPIEVDPLEVRRGALVELLDLLSPQFNLTMAAGDAIESGGEFVFAVEHDDGDDGPTTQAAALLVQEGYRNVRIIEVHVCEVNHEPGALATCLRELTDAGRRIDEIYVGVRRDDGVVPVQVTTIREVD